MTREEYIMSMRPVAKPSTTSRCTTGDGGVTPTRADDDIKRRELQTRLTTPTASEQIIDRNIRLYRERQSAEAAADKAKADHARTDQRARQEATQREIERLRRVKDFKLKEHLIEGVFAESGLTPAERARVTERLLAMGDVHNTDAATIFAQEEVLSRGARRPDESNGMDWRSIITAKKK